MGKESDDKIKVGKLTKKEKKYLEEMDRAEKQASDLARKDAAKERKTAKKKPKS